MKKHPQGNMAERAGLGARFAAFLIDTILLSIVVGALSGALFFAAPMDSGPGGGAFGAVFLVVQLLVLVLTFGYWIVMEAIYGYTLGKLALGLVVVTDDGHAIGWKESLIRNVLRIVDAFPTLYIVGIVTILLTDGQRVGDLAASTEVVKQT